MRNTMCINSVNVFNNYLSFYRFFNQRSLKIVGIEEWLLSSQVRLIVKCSRMFLKQ